MDQRERRIWLIRELIKEQTKCKSIEMPSDENEQRKLLRALFNIRPPMEASAEFIQIQDDYLTELAFEKGIVNANDLPTIASDSRLVLWQGDITGLQIDAIVNAANSGMTGCYRPNHTCIDNCIHTFAGVRLRSVCQKQMDEQGHEEDTGLAKITTAFNLPSTYILHTVGPIVNGELTENHKKLLANCYTSCLKLAEQYGLSSVAFCCISTDVFGFPQKEAAEIAIRTVNDYLTNSNQIGKVVFNVFQSSDYKIYRKLLGADTKIAK